MMMIPITTKEDKYKAVEILTSAFFDAPNLSWIFLNKTNKNMAFFFLTILNDVAAKNGAFLSSNKKGVLFFYNLNNKHISIANIFRKIYILLFITGLLNGIRMIKHNRNMSKIRPKTGWLGMLMATANNNVVAAYEIKIKMDKASKDSNLPIYVETTVPRVRALYEAAGYREYFTLKHPFTSLDVWFMSKECIE